MISYLDDHSRFIPGSRIHHDPTAEHAIKLLKEAMRQYGKPDQILTDRGTQFHTVRGGVSEFTEFCSGNDIEHIVVSLRRPSTIGKIEAFHKVYFRIPPYFNRSARRVPEILRVRVQSRLPKRMANLIREKVLTI